MMLENYNVNNEMQYQKLSAEEQQERGILGRLVGIIADFKNATRNGRRYTEELWDKAFKNPIMREKFENRCLFGELGHPVDRQEVDMEKVCICMAEPPKKGNDGKLYGVFDILNTPNGRILSAYSVSPTFFFKIAGPIPRENEVTPIPPRLAKIKCPSSWKKINKPKINNATIMLNLPPALN